MDAKDIKCPLEWWAKHESMFPTVAFFIHYILSNIGFQIEIERFFHWLEFLQIWRDVYCNQIVLIN